MITKTQQKLLCKLPEKIIKRKEGCWLWEGGLNRNGYGRIYHEGSKRKEL